MRQQQEYVCVAAEPPNRVASRQEVRSAINLKPNTYKYTNTIYACVCVQIWNCCIYIYIFFLSRLFVGNALIIVIIR